MPDVARDDKGLRLEYLDGLRGFASFYVLLFHVVLGFQAGPLPTLAKPLQRLLAFGHEAVAVFIVLSGYCLTLSATRVGKSAPTAPLGTFLGRRALRILPPYYGAVLLGLATVAAVPFLNGHAPTNTIWDDTFPAFSWGSLASHALVIHNWFPEWVHTINGPLWSVATEWQIYFLFPLLFLPLLRRLGKLPMILIGLGIGYGLPLVAPTLASTMVSWYVGLFALGIGACLVHFGSASDRQLASWPWKGAAISLVGFCFIGGNAAAGFWFSHQKLSDFLVGLTTACALVALTGSAIRRQSSPILRLLEGRFAQTLGRISYSLYLTHLPITAVAFTIARPLSQNPWLHLGAMLALSVPTSFLFALLYYRFVEGPFVTRSRNFGLATQKSVRPVEHP